jgi:hypothetical protein
MAEPTVQNCKTLTMGSIPIVASLLAERTPGACSAGRSRFLGDRFMTTTPLPQLESYIPIAVAARRFGIADDRLQKLVGSGAVKAAKLPDGEVVVSEDGVRQAASYEKINQRLRGVRRENFAKLRGRPITIAEAIAKYEVPKTTLRTWIVQGYVTELQSGYGATFDESDVAFCAKVYWIRKEFGSLSGASLLTASGDPQEIKNPRLAEYRRKRKREVAGNGRHAVALKS